MSKMNPSHVEPKFIQIVAAADNDSVILYALDDRGVVWALDTDMEEDTPYVWTRVNARRE